MSRRQEFPKLRAISGALGIALLSVCLSGVAAAGAGQPDQVPKELVGYIQNAKRLGLSDNQIRRNAISGGWDAKIVDEALVVADRAQVRPGPSQDLTVPADYRIGVGDVLQISVWKEPEASVAGVTVRADGRITIPLVKDIEVIGLTPREVETLVAEKLSRYIPAADVTVIVMQINSRKLYLVGAIRSVGAIDLRGDMTVLQAIAQAGGLTDYAKRKQIYILRNENGRQVKLPFNYDAVIRGENMEQNIKLSPNDMIVVPQ